MRRRAEDRSLSHLIRGLLLTCAVAAAGAMASEGSAAPPGGGPGIAARTCPVPRYPGSGYFTSLSVQRVGCGTGRRVALAYYRCRTRSGPKGRCKRRTVSGYRCRERRQSIETEIDGLVSCPRGRRKVTHSYQQQL